MKTNTIKNYPFTADYRGYTQVTSADGTVTETRYDTLTTPVTLMVSVNFIGDLDMQSETKMQIDSIIENIRDSAGNEIYENGKWTITQTMPRINALYLKDGYSYKARMISGDI